MHITADSLIYNMHLTIKKNLGFTTKGNNFFIFPIKLLFFKAFPNYIKNLKFMIFIRGIYVLKK